MRVGIGYDIHALRKGRKLVLGGVTIPSPKGPAGHSDGDALLHAIVDAALGAAGLGDIGGHFSDRDPRWKGVSSLVFAKQTAVWLKKKKLKVAHIDSIVVLESPKLSPHKKAMRDSIARAFGVRADRVNVKAKTNEGFGPVGKGQAVVSSAVVVLEKA
jgi:2-C-methyl-D-erythritol 2,4-cyclodiphosphate synthase